MSRKNAPGGHWDLSERIISGQLPLSDLGDAELAVLGDAVRQESRRRIKPPPPRLPRRALAIDALELLRMPATPRLLSWAVTARTGDELDARLLTTLRRDDHLAWAREAAAGRKPGMRLAPALHYELFEPVRALLTLSTWPLKDRMVTPHSPRADHPNVILRLLDEAERLDDVDAAAAVRLTALAARLAIGLPGAALPVPPGSDIARKELRVVAMAERDRFSTLADEERTDAAGRASELGDEHRVWGTPGIGLMADRPMDASGAGA